MDEQIMQTQRLRITWQLSVVLFMSWLLAGCGINNIPTYDEQVKAAWAQVENQYQRRADLVPNLVEAMFTDFPGNSGETVRISIKPEER